MKYRFLPLLIAVLLVTACFVSCRKAEEDSTLYSVEELSAAVGFTVVFPRTLPSAYHVQSFEKTDTVTAGITYLFQGSNDHLYYRMSTDSISPSPQETEGGWQDTLTAGNISIRVYGTGSDTIRTAVWSIGGFTYIIASDKTFTDSELLNIIAGIA